eukprot:TRINITY_DN2274_c0_g1_i2.p1 TRINITY_DN2274_c0_g1~~TRINITY_DN2274_c0_g1_i2.p1  ORF type:complete len:482 (-),score=64.79 TRINITY_DN2274_c0_g1_i2:242-1687(-)
MVQARSILLSAWPHLGLLTSTAANNLDTKHAQTRENFGKIICPYLSTLINEGVWEVKSEYTKEEMDAILVASGIDSSFVSGHSAANFANNPNHVQDIYNMEGASNEHKTSTGITDCPTTFSDCHVREDGIETCTTHTPECGVPNEAIFGEFVAKVDADADGFITSEELREAVDKNSLPVADVNPFGRGDIFVSCDAVIRVMGEWKNRISVADLHRVFILRKFPLNGYFFGRTSIPPPETTHPEPLPTTQPQQSHFTTPMLGLEKAPVHSPRRRRPRSGTVVTRKGAECFPGHALVETAARGRVSMSELRVAEPVLVEDAAGTLRYDLVLGFLHEAPDIASSYITVLHSSGEFRASDNHIVFTHESSGVLSDKTASSLVPGDHVRLVDEDAAASPAKVLAVRRDSSESGMFAPLSASGKLIVDHLTASSYAAAPMGASVSHCTLHAAFFAVRLLPLMLPQRGWQSGVYQAVWRFAGFVRRSA